MDCAGYRAAATCFDGYPFIVSDKLLTDECFAALAEAAVLAPSADNGHVFHIEKATGSLRLWATPGFMVAPFHRRVLGLISLGAAAENVMLRAKRLGLCCGPIWFPDPQAPEILAEFRFEEGAQDSNALEAALASRHTNRRLVYHGPPLSTAERGLLDADVNSVPGAMLLWLDAPSLRRDALRLIASAESERFRNRPLHQELFGSIRFDAGWEGGVAEGLAPASLEIELPMRPIFTALRHWPLQRVLNTVGLHHLIALRAAYIPCRITPHLGVLSTSLEVELGAIAIGRALERAWLRATTLGFAFQPFAASTLLALEGYKDVPPTLRHRLADGWRRITGKGRALMVFRLGRAAPASARSGRQALETYVRHTADN